MASSLHFSLLGDPQVTNNNDSVTGFISSKAQALLYYLAATGQPHSRDHLATLFWGYMPSAAARKNLTKALSNLRKLIGSILITDHQNAALASEAVALDLHAFHTLLRRSPTSYTGPDPNPLAHLHVDQVWQADELYRGPFLNNFIVRDAPEFELWMETMREECRHLLTVALEDAAEQALHSGTLEQALALSERTLYHEPTWEPAHRRLMTLLARLERVEEALAHYERCCHTLRQELGVEPAVETTRLYETLKAANTPPPHNLPTATTRFVGRETELLTLSTLLCSADCRLLTITGAGGVGKTRLALQLANQFTNPLTTHTLNCSFPDGIYFLSLTSLDSAETIIAMMAERLGFTFYVEGNSKKQLLDALQDRQTLLVLDNVEHLVDTGGDTDGGQHGNLPAQLGSELIALVTEILAGSPHLKIVMTSRARLNMHGEHLFSLGGLHFPEQLGSLAARGTAESSRLDLASDTEYSAVQLFVQCARRLQADYVLLDQDWPAVVRICQLVQGMPLGILLAAAWMDIYTPAEIAEEINRSFDFLAADLPDLPLRQRSIRAAIDRSWRMLAPQEQQLFERLSIFRGSLSRRAAQQVANATPHLLQSLVKKSLLQPVVKGRFALHELLRQYAHEKLAATSPTALEIGKRHSAYFVEATVAWTPALKDERQQQTLKAMETDSENLRVAWQWFVAHGDVESLLAMVNGLSQFYVWRGRYQEGADGIASALARLPFFQQQDDRLLVAKLHLSLTIWHGLFLRLLGQIEHALQRGQAALAQLQRAPLVTEEMRAEEGFAWLQLGHTLRDLDRSAAQNAYERSLQAYRAINESWGTANALDALGWLIQHLGAYDEARTLYQESLTIRQQLQDQRGIAGSLRALGGITLYQGYHQEAEQLIRQSIAIYGEINDQAGIAAGFGKLGETLTLLGRPFEAIEPLEESIPIYHTLGLQTEEMFARAVLAHVHIHVGEYELAVNTLQPAYDYFDSASSKRGIAYTELLRGWTLLALGYPSDAALALQKSASIYQDIRQLDELGQAQALLGICAHQCGDRDAATNYHALAVATADEIHAFMPRVLADLLKKLLTYTMEQNVESQQGAISQSAHPLVTNSQWFAAISRQASA